MRRRQPAAVLAAVLAAGLLVACGADDEPAADDAPAAATSPASGDDEDTGDDEGEDAAGHGHGDAPAKPVRSAPLRDGERFLDVAMPAAYEPSAPYGSGTDDYRCFLLDPGLTQDAFLTGIDVEPGNAEVVHHVILFHVAPDGLAQAEQADAAEPGQGWTCFGGTGLAGEGASLDSAPWIGAWAPGGGESVHEADVGVPLESGSRVIMQVHYNLLAGTEPDTSSARLRLADGDSGLTPLETVLLPAPVELPCRDGVTGQLCSREAAMDDVQQRFGRAGQLGDLIHLLCGPVRADEVQTCTRPAPSDMTIRAAAGHMHLLGREISIDVDGRSVLDIDVWDFDDQGADPVEPVQVRKGQQVTVTCRHDQALRDQLPAFEGQDERYVVWGEGTTDEMCLGILLVTRG
jgi:hypothetical protein